MTDKKRLEELEIGDYVVEGYNQKRQLLVSNFPVHERADLNRLREIGVKTCTIRTDTGKTEPPETATEERKEAAPFGVVERTRRTYRNTLERLDELVPQIHENRDTALQLDSLKPFLNDFISHIEDCPASVSCLTQIQQFDDMTYHHSINVSLLSLLYGHFEGFEESLLLKFGFGALVHDIGKTRLARRILQNDRDLTDKERAIVEKHPEKGRRILLDAGYSDAVQKIALQHHIRNDGSGYPERDGPVHPLARIVSVIDEYEALIAVGPNRERPHPIKAYTRLKDEFYDFNETRTVLENLIHVMGLYPIGCLVELSTDDIAVVIENNTDHLRYPRVSVVGSRSSGSVDDPYTVDLEHIRHQKRAVDGKIYDDRTQVEQVLDYQNAPSLREHVPRLIQEHHAGE